MAFGATARYVQTEWLASIGDVARLTDASGAHFGNPEG
jgi:hypothetical protein